MTSVRKGHVAKSVAERTRYRKYIDRLDYEPTVDDTLTFADSDRGDKDVTQQVPAAARPVPYTTRFKSFLSVHWFDLLVAIFVFILLFATVDSKVDLARISTALDAQKETLKDLKSDIKDRTSDDHNQDLQLREHSVRLQNLESSLSKTSK
ncbi:MAG TPA: hypothetical protein VMS71_00490 [Candidatus Acidoferrum sp.]|nr:hypothetical protein [Candidatus Acidoferrum sp.]